MSKPKTKNLSKQAADRVIAELRVVAKRVGADTAEIGRLLAEVDEMVGSDKYTPEAVRILDDLSALCLAEADRLRSSVRMIHPTTDDPTEPAGDQTKLH
jgi:hypothetical protein